MRDKRGGIKMKIKEVPVPKKLADVKKYMEDRIGLGVSFDLGLRELAILRKKVHIYYVNGLCDSVLITEILEGLLLINDTEKPSTNLSKIIENRLVNESVEKVETMDEIVDQLLSGLIVVLVEGDQAGLILDAREYPGRDPEEPDTEKVVRGSRDGFVENIVLNSALTRRRIRDERLRFELVKVGERSKTDIAIVYLKDVANLDLIKVIKKEIKAIDVDGLTMADKSIEEFLLKQGYNPYPLVRYTERADVAATHLLEGHVLVYVDTSPSVMITPTTYFHHVQHAEEFRQSPAVGTFIRWARFFAIIVSIFLVPLWYLFILEPGLLPKELSFIGPNDKSHIPIFLQIVFADLGIELLRIAAIHTPTPLATAMGLIAAVLIGEIAINVGLFVGEVILYVAVAQIGTFATPSYELGVANKLVRIFLLVAVALFKVPGLIIGTTVYLLLLVRVHSLDTPYLWPLLPFNPKAFLQIFVRTSVPGSKIRPSIVHARNRFKQPTNNRVENKSES